MRDGSDQLYLVIESIKPVAIKKGKSGVWDAKITPTVLGKKLQAPGRGTCVLMIAMALKIAQENEALLPASYNLAAIYAQLGQKQKALSSRNHRCSGRQ